MMWFFRHFWIFISYHIFLLNQVEGAIAIPPSNSAPPATLLSVRLSVRLSVNRSVNHIFRFLHICWQVTGKEWHRVRNADVSRWLTLGQHWCRWVLLSFHAFVRPSNHPWAWVCVLHTKRLEEMAYNLACWCIQMAYTQHSWMLMDIVVGLSVRPSVRLFVYGIFRWLCICWQITWNKWHKIWHDDVVIIGRWLLPSLVDTGDICCHYWQLILVYLRLRRKLGQESPDSKWRIETRNISGAHSHSQKSGRILIFLRSCTILHHISFKDRLFLGFNYHQCTHYHDPCYLCHICHDKRTPVDNICQFLG